MVLQGKIVQLKELVGKTDAQIFLIVGPPGTGKEYFALQYIIDGLAEKKTGAILTTDRFQEEIIELMKELGTDPQPFIKNKQLTFIDAFSYRTGISPPKESLAVNDIRDLTGLSLIIKRLTDSVEQLLLVIGTLSTLTVFNRDIAFLDFLQSQVARLKQKNHGAIFIAHQGIMEEKALQGIRALVDGVIEFKFEERSAGTLQRKLRVEYAPNIKMQGWIDLY